MIVVNEGVTSLREVTKGQTHGDFVVIEKGLEAGETVVVEGQVNLFPGAKVTINHSQGVPTNFKPGFNP